MSDTVSITESIMATTSLRVTHITSVVLRAFGASLKRRRLKFNGVSTVTFNLHLKECEYSFNRKHKYLYRELFKPVENYPLQTGSATPEPLDYRRLSKPVMV